MYITPVLDPPKSKRVTPAGKPKVNYSGEMAADMSNYLFMKMVSKGKCFILMGFVI